MNQFLTSQEHEAHRCADFPQQRKSGALSKLRYAFLLLCVVCLQISAVAQNITVTGVVSDEENEPLIGASVQIKGTSNGVTTNIDGEYTISAPKNGTLVVSYVGYDAKEVAVNGQTTINIKMESNATMLNEVVAVGYGTMKKSDLTGAISSVNTEKLNAKGAPSVLENLQGTTPGVSITKSNGRTNGGFDVEIRGKSSINSNTKPLYVVDGVQCGDIDFLNPQDIERIDVLKDASSTAIYGSRATAGVIIVTTKGGANVNKENKASISYDGYYGINHAARMPDFMDGAEYYRYRLLKFTQPVDNVYGPQPVYGFGATPQLSLGQALLQQTKTDYSSPYMLKEMVANGDTYFWPDLVTRDGHQQNHYIAVSGASDSANYHFGLGLNKEEGMYVGDESQTISFKGSVDAKINKVINAGFNVNLARIDNDYASDNAISQAYRVNPFMRPFDAEGNIIMYPGAKAALGTDDHQFTDFLNPLLNMKNQKHERRTYRALGNVYLSLNVLPGLNIKTTFSPSYSSYRDGSFTGYINPDTGKTYDNKDPEEDGAVTASVTNSTSFSWTWDNIINYVRTFNDIHNVNVMGLFSMEDHRSEKFEITSNNVIDRTDWWNLGSGSQDGRQVKSEYKRDNMISYAIRAHYTLMDRYLLTATMRWDGCSKFYEGHKWGAFPSAAVAWRMNDEAFMKDIDWISNLKLRASYGVTGNNGIGQYATIVGIGGPVYYPFGSAHTPGFYPNGIIDEHLSWEKSHEWNIGVDYGFFNNRINGSVEYYRKKSNDLLFNVDLPLEAGGISMPTNIGSVLNRGVEFSINTINVQTRNFEWSTTLTGAFNHNEVLEINGVSPQIINAKNPETQSLFVGRPFHNIYSYVWDGIVSDKNMTVPNHPIATEKGYTPGETVRMCDYYYDVYGITEGQPYVRDVNGDGKITDEDRVITNSDPKFTGSLTSNMSYTLPKQAGTIDFSFSLYTKLGHHVWSPFMGSDYYDYHDRGRGKMMMDYYIPAGQLIDCDGIAEDGTYINPVYQTETHYGTYPVVNCGESDGLGKHSSYFQKARSITNASFLKVKNITVGYTFHKSILNHIGCKQARLYFTVTNPFVFTKYKGFDPEWAGAATKNDGPSIVSYQIGASIKF